MSIEAKGDLSVTAHPLLGRLLLAQISLVISSLSDYWSLHDVFNCGPPDAFSHALDPQQMELCHLEYF